MKTTDLVHLTSYGATPDKRQLDHLKLGKKAFFHFGVNTFSGNEWGNGKEIEEMFNPTDLDVRSWVKGVKRAGFKLCILTAKHHDGFCLWPSKYTEHSVKNSPYKNGCGDVVKEFTDACAEFNVKVGIYISPWDRNSVHWGKPDYNDFFANQLTELLTEYGTIDEIWWDGAGSSEAKYDWGKWAFLVKKHQPNAVIFGSMGAAQYVDMRWVGNELGYAGATHYASIDRHSIFVENTTELNVGKIGGDAYVPAEVDVSIRPGWFYHKEQDDMVKSVRELDELWFNSVGKNAVMLLNFPPDATGHIVQKDLDNATESNARISNMLAVNLLNRAKVSSNGAASIYTDIDKALFDDDDLFFVGKEESKEVQIDIEFNDISTYNVLLLGEKVEFGERVSSFKLFCFDGEQETMLAEGTSIGYLKAVRFKESSAKRLRIILNSAASPITLRHLSLHKYNEDKTDNCEDGSFDLANSSASSIEISPDRSEAIISFGGIFSFDTVAFTLKEKNEFEILAFDGSKFYSVLKKKAHYTRVSEKLNKKITGAYQIKIITDGEISDTPDFYVS